MRMLKLVLAVVLTLSIHTFAQIRYEMGGLFYTWPTAHDAGSLVNNGSGTLALGVAGEAGVLVMYNGDCPTGWSEYTNTRGRYVVGVPSGGTNAATAGTALTNLQDRDVSSHTHTSTTTVTLSAGSHTHEITDPQHRHTANDQGSSGSDPNPSGGSIPANGGNFASNTTGITLNNSSSGAGVTATATPTINNAGSVTGTNAPYMQLRYCQFIP